KLAVGVKTADASVRPCAHVPATAGRMLALFPTASGSTGRLKLTVIGALSATPVAFGAGLVLAMVRNSAAAVFCVVWVPTDMDGGAEGRAAAGIADRDVWLERLYR